MLRSPIFLLFFRGGGGSDPLSPLWIRARTDNLYRQPHKSTKISNHERNQCKMANIDKDNLCIKSLYLLSASLLISCSD